MKFNQLGFEPLRFTKILLSLAIILVLLSLVIKMVHLHFDPPHLRALIALFYVDLEHNVPTWYSSMLLFSAAICLACIAFVEKLNPSEIRSHRYWALLCLLFLCLSADEVSQIHEYPIEPLRNALNADGLLYYTWVIPGMMFVAAVPVFFWPLLKSLPKQVRNGMIGAGAIFVGGAIGVEMISGLAANATSGAPSENTTFYVLTVSLEEFMEMTGVIYFIYVLTTYLKSLTTDIEIHFVEKNSSELV